MKLYDEKNVNNEMLQSPSEADLQAGIGLSRHQAPCCLADLPGDLFFHILSFVNVYEPYGPNSPDHATIFRINRYTASDQFLERYTRFFARHYVNVTYSFLKEKNSINVPLATYRQGHVRTEERARLLRHACRRFHQEGGTSVVETLFHTAKDSPRSVYYQVRPMRLFDELKAERSSRRAFQINSVLSLLALLSFALFWLNAQSQREADQPSLLTPG
jgi:hypothetical protein